MHLKTRTPYYLNQLSDSVHTKLNMISEETKLAKWLIVEKILEKFFNLESEDGINVEAWIGDARKIANTGKKWAKRI